MHFCKICEIKFLVGGPWKSNVVIENSLKNGCNFLYEPCYIYMIKFNKAKSPSVKLLTIPNNNNFKKWTALQLVFDLTHLFENKEPLNSCYYLNGQTYALETKRNGRETLNLRGCALTICKKKLVGMKPFNDQFNPTGRGTRRNEPFGFLTGKVRPNGLQEALSEHGIPK